jgi:hypothetical protein
MELIFIREERDMHCERRVALMLFMLYSIVSSIMQYRTCILPSPKGGRVQPNGRGVATTSQSEKKKK